LKSLVWASGDTGHRMSSVLLPARYRDPTLVGEGATGVVFRVVDTEANESAAIKVVRPHLAQLDRFRARFAREVALSASLVHPNIVPVRDFGQLQTRQPYVVMDYADRGSLAERLADHLPVGQLLDWIDDVLKALGHLHARGLVHRDIKPENVLLQAGGAARELAWVADFGLAGARTEVAFTGESLAGTREWMAPEQASGRVQELGPWTDLYAVGLVLNLALGGEPVRLKRERGGRFHPGPVDLPDSVPPGLARVVCNLLHPDPRQRYDRSADVRRALAAARADMSTAAESRRVSTTVIPSSTTTFPVPLTQRGLATVANLLPEGADAGSTPPAWNRVPPGALSASLPEHSGVGASTHALGVYSLREPPPPRRPLVQRVIWESARDVVQQSRPRVVLLVGRDGSGKSRLADAYAEILDEGGHMEAVTLRYHDPPEDDDGFRGAVLELLAPWNDGREDAIRRIARWLARDRGVGPEAVTDEAEALARWCGYRSPRRPPLNAGLGLAYLLRHLDARGWRGGATLVVQDAHHARGRAEGLGICRALLEETVGVRPILVLATLSREALEENPALEADLAELSALGAIRIDVDRLSEASMAEFLRSALQVDRDLAARLALRCGGGPTFATLLIRDLAVRGLLKRNDDGHLVLASGDARADISVLVPHTMDDLAARRIDGAIASTEDPAGCARALAIAALAGQGPPARVVRAASGEALDHLLGTGLVSQRGFRLVFESLSIRAVVVRRALAQANRAELHHRLAEAWAAVGEAAGADVDLNVGRHRLGAEEPADAVVPLLRAARSALASGRPHMAQLAGQLALDAATASDRQMARVEARQLIAVALLDQDRPGDAAALLASDGDEWRMDRRSRAKDNLLSARAAMEIGDLDGAEAHLHRAATAYEATRDRSGMVETCQQQAALFRLRGRPLRAAERYSRVLRLARDYDLNERVAALAGRMQCLVAAGRLVQAHRDRPRLQEAARQSQDTHSIALAAFASGLLHLVEGQPEPGERNLRTALALAATLGEARFQVQCENVLGEIARQVGDWQQASERYSRAARIARRKAWAPAAAVAHLNLALLHLGHDDQRAKEEHRAAKELVGAESSHWIRIFVALLSAIWAAEDHHIDDARGHLQDAVEAGLAQMPLPDARVLLERVATHARSAGASYLESRALELAGELSVDAAIESEYATGEIPRVVVEDPSEGPTDIAPAPDVSG
jgi:serine/threonine protein kinase/tetratricopeptide (TPR) repeat protein